MNDEVVRFVVIDMKHNFKSLIERKHEGEGRRFVAMDEVLTLLMRVLDVGASERVAPALCFFFKNEKYKPN